MLRKGYSFKHNKAEGLAHFVDSESQYIDYPAGYITGPCYQDTGSGRPWYASIKGTDGWRQRSFTNRQEAVDWALAAASGGNSPAREN